MDTTLGERELLTLIRLALSGAERALNGGYRYTFRACIDDALKHANALIERRQRESGE